MTVSAKTVREVVNTMLSHKKDFTTDELIKALGYSRSTVRQAVSHGLMNGSIVKVPGSYPAKFKVITQVPQMGETLIIKEVAPPAELNKEMMNQIRLLIAKDKFDESLSDQLAKFYRDAPPAKRTQFKDFLVNFVEVMKQDIESSKTLDISDIQIGKK